MGTFETFFNSLWQGAYDGAKKGVCNWYYHTGAKVLATEILITVGDWNGHVGTPASVFSNAHGGYGYEAHDTKGSRIMEIPAVSQPS